MVAIDKIDFIEKDRIKVKDLLIPVSDSYRKPFFDRITNARQRFGHKSILFGE